jgi:hypothetical protein
MTTIDDTIIRIGEFDQMFDDYYDFVNHINDECPKTVPEALAGPDKEQWRQALNKEVQAHLDNKTLGPPIDPKDLPPGVTAIKMDVLLSVKRSSRKKARAIVKGYRMTQGIDYNETFSPVPCITSLRTLLAIATKHNWEIKQGDVQTAFLAAPIDTKIIIAVPNYFKLNATADMTGYTYRYALKAMNGIPQGPRLFTNKSSGVFKKSGLQQCRSEPCLFFSLKHSLYLIVWVDDIFLFFPTECSKYAEQLWTEIQKELKLDDMADIDDCLACVVKRDRSNCRLWLTQEPAIRKMMLRLDFNETNAKDTPMVPNCKLSKKDCPSAEQAAVMKDEQTWFRSTIACFIYFHMWTRLDISYSVSKLCKFMHNPGRVHIIALKRLLRYLNSAADLGLCYDFSKSRTASNIKTGIYGYYDASHADCPDTMRSTLAYIFFYEHCPISWHTKLHTLITTSTNHSEYCAAAKAAKEAKWFDKFMTELGFSSAVRPIDLFSDSKGAIALTYNPVQRSASKHIDLADHYAREQQEQGVITISYVNTTNMLADLLTKPLPREAFQRHVTQLMATVQL